MKKRAKDMKNCPVCNVEVERDIDICPECGHQFLTDQEDANQVEEVEVKEVSKEEKNKSKKDNNHRPTVNKLDKDAKKSMTVRIITAVILALLVVPAFFVGGWWFIVVVFITLSIAIYEFIKATQVKKGFVFLYLFVYIMTYSLTFWIFMKNNMIANEANGIHPFNVKEWHFYTGFERLEVSTFGILVTLMFIVITLIFVPKFDFSTASYIFFMIIIVGLGFQAFLFLRFFPQHMANDYDVGFTSKGVISSFLLLYVVIGTIGTDIGAYFVGVLFGKRKLIPRISPNKTVEGFIGGIVLSFVASFLFALICSLVGNPILPFLSHHQWYYIVLISILMPFFATLGDLFFSLIKRKFDIKDFGNILKGHGGILDRIDSLLVVALAVSIIIIFMHNGWSFLV
ncbi:MAG: phosphatidate cytidylyltransferase [Bacilli bacterium]|jgi:phosphatidate cytidylyltransferase